MPAYFHDNEFKELQIILSKLNKINIGFDDCFKFILKYYKFSTEKK